jgi:hypothetical protein
VFALKSGANTAVGLNMVSKPASEVGLETCFTSASEVGIEVVLDRGYKLLISLITKLVSSRYVEICIGLQPFHLCRVD